MASEKVPLTEGGPQKSSFPTIDDLAGRILYERFLIERNLTDHVRGDICSSYLAKDLKHFCRRVIVKAVTPTESSAQSNSFQDICKTLIRLDHPNIEWILETGRLFDGRPYAVTTYVSGRSLDEWLEGDRRLVLDRVANIVESVAAALDAAHSRKILHANVAPRNIFITPEENEAESVRLTNFGCLWPADLGRARFAEIRSGCESVLYTAPELMAEDGRATPASDIYSLAAVAYRMLTGEVPFRAADRTKMLALIVKGVPAGRPRLRTDLSADAEAMLLSALQYKPLMRPRDVRTFGLELANELRHRPSYINILRPIELETAALIPVEPIIEISVEAPAAPASVIEPRRKQVPKAPALVSDRAIAWALITLLLAGALSIPIGQTILDEGEKPAAVNSILKKSTDTRLAREIRFSIDEPKRRGDKSLDSNRKTAAFTELRLKPTRLETRTFLARPPTPTESRASTSFTR